MLVRLAALAAAMLLTTAAHAEYVDLGAPVLGHPGTTYADLVSQFVSGFQLTDKDSATADVRMAYRFVEADDVMEYDDIPGPVTIDTAAAQPFHSGGKPMLAVRADLQGDGGWPIVVLAVFDADLKLVDKAQIDRDRMVGLDLMEISPDDDAIIVHSSHANAGENYESTQLVYLAQGQLTALPSIEGYSVLACAYENRATTGYEVWDSSQPGFWPITATLQIDHNLHDDCSDGDGADLPWTKSAMRTYAWSASLGLYVENSDGITALNAEYGPE